MTDYTEIRAKLLDKQKELSGRLQSDQAIEEPKDELSLDEGAQRLEAMPFATLCIDCAEDAEGPEAFDPNEY